MGRGAQVGHERAPEITKEQQRRLDLRRAFDQGKASTKISVATCTVFSSSPIACPLCGITVKPWNVHTCAKENA